MTYNTYQKLHFVVDESRNTIRSNRSGASVLNFDNLPFFTDSMKQSLRLFLKEKELIFLAALQWLFVAVGYLAVIKFIDWVPDEYWRELMQDTRGSRRGSGTICLTLMAWSAFVVIVISYPIGILTSAMAAVHMLHEIYETSTLSAALRLAMKNQGRVWAFASADGWITAKTIHDRLPSRRGRGLDKELLYYAWKLGTIGIIPALVNGKGLIDAGKDSLGMIKKHPWLCIKLRFSYSLVCWIIGVVAYISAVLIILSLDLSIGDDNLLYILYLWLFIPIVISTGIVMVVVRPFYILSVARLYTDTYSVDENNIEVALGSSGGAVLFFLFLILLTALGAIIFFAGPLGIEGWLADQAAAHLSR